ncbi:MAG: hypothetical protein ACM3MF_04100 [Anaerolineae bacterium]
MDRRFGYFIFAGAAIGALFGLGIGAANGNTLFGLGEGALVGVFLGWFVAAAVMEREKQKK